MRMGSRVGGLRDVANGGIGVILDAESDDTYRFDYIAPAADIGSAGFAATSVETTAARRTQMYNSDARRERAFSDSSNGFGCHYALGFLFDDAGTIRTAGQSWAWDLPGTARLPT